MARHLACRPPVTSRQFAALAAVVARHAEELSAPADPPPAAALHRVWRSASACFRDWREELTLRPSPRHYAELFSAELPLRVWCTAVAIPDYDRRGRGAAVAGRVFGEMLDLRCLALQALAADHGLTAAEAASVDRFRRRCERWADVLLAPLARRRGVTDFAVSPERALDFAADSDDGLADDRWPLVTVGLHLAFVRSDEFRGPTTPPTALDHAAALSASILACFPPAAFGDGRLRTPEAGRAGRLVAETRPARPARRIARPVERPASAPSTEPPAEPSPAHAISFASLRRQRHPES